MATDFSIGIKNVGPNLMCDFLKESGFTDYAKMDVHMIRSMSEVLQFNKDDKLPDYESLFGIEEEELKEIVEKLANKDYQTLELTATIVFVVNKNICENSKEIVKKKMNVLKPHLMEKYDGAWALAESYFKKN